MPLEVFKSDKNNVKDNVSEVRCVLTWRSTIQYNFIFNLQKKVKENLPSSEDQSSRVLVTHIISSWLLTLPYIPLLVKIFVKHLLNIGKRKS